MCAKRVQVQIYLQVQLLDRLQPMTSSSINLQIILLIVYSEKYFKKTKMTYFNVDQLSKTQRYLIYNAMKQTKAANSYIGEAELKYE